MQIWAEPGKSALPICNYSQILYQFLQFTQNLKRSHETIHAQLTLVPFQYHKAKNKLANAHFTRLCELLKIIQTPRRETYYPCESLISRAFNGDYSAFYHNYFMFSKIQVSYRYQCTHLVLGLLHKKMYNVSLKNISNTYLIFGTNLFS